MRYTALFLILFSSITFAKERYKRKCSLSKSSKPMCYHQRDLPILKIALLHYGNTMTIEDLDRVSLILKDRYSKATDGAITLEIEHMEVLDFKHKMPVDYKFNKITDKDRLQRIWYGETIGGKVTEEIYELYKERFPEKIKSLDAILTITGAQFNGLGLANGRISVTEYPQEIAWALENGGRTEYPSDYKLVDELIHELGHNMFLGHTSPQCFNPNLSLSERKKCCDESASRNDVLSYCRDRKKVDENFMYGFEACTLDMIKNKVVPAMLKGKRWNIKNRSRCL